MAAEVTGARLLDALAAQPGGRQLLALAGDREDLALVGGAVRDLLLGRTPRELDVVTAGDAEALAGELAALLGASTTVHGRFGTAAVEWEGGRIDVAERRAESYAQPGALPQVRPGTAREDLDRRDFTVNALLVALAGAHRGELQGAEHALEDLRAGRMRVLHDASFIDDPTRLLRLARYRARLGFAVEAHTAELAARAATGDALATVSRARVGAELRLALGESDAPAALAAIDELGLLAALHPRLRWDGGLAGAALELLSCTPRAATRAPRPDLLLLAVTMQPTLADRDAGAEPGVEADMRALLDELEFTAGDRDLALGAAVRAGALAAALAAAGARSQVHGAASGSSPEGVALAGALGEREGGGLAQAAIAAREWLAELCDVRLLIGGDDLLAAGIPEGLEIRRRLEAALRLKLDGEIASAGRDAELSAALEARV
jgi:tRNA nucleotidyltransferase (CCA-adding enzyme)